MSCLVAKFGIFFFPISIREFVKLALDTKDNVNEEFCKCQFYIKKYILLPDYVIVSFNIIFPVTNLDNNALRTTRVFENADRKAKNCKRL